MSFLSPADQPFHAHKFETACRQLRRNLVQLLRSFETGISAAHDYQSLGRLTDRQLGEAGLRRQDLARHISAKHFS